MSGQAGGKPAISMEVPVQEYPKWLPVDGPGHPQNPGHVLVSNEDEEATAKTSGTGPADLNPPPDAGQKALADMDRDELKQILLNEGIPEDMTDDDIRAAIEAGRERRAQYAQEDADKAREQREAREAGGDHGDGQETVKVPPADDKPGEDAAGDKIAPNPADEANKVPGDDPTRSAPAATSQPGTDTRPEGDAREKLADGKPAGNVTEQAATPPKHKRGSTDKPGRA